MQHLQQELATPTRGAFSILDFLRRLGHDGRHPGYPGGDEAMAKLLLRTRVFALGRLIASDDTLSPQVTSGPNPDPNPKP